MSCSPGGTRPRPLEPLDEHRVASCGRVPASFRPFPVRPAENRATRVVGCGKHSWRRRHRWSTAFRLCLSRYPAGATASAFPGGRLERGKTTSAGRVGPLSPIPLCAPRRSLRSIRLTAEFAESAVWAALESHFGHIPALSTATRDCELRFLPITYPEPLARRLRTAKCPPRISPRGATAD